MLTPFFLTAEQAAGMSASPVPTQIIQNYADALKCNTQAYGKFFRAMLDRGIFLAPSQFEAAFVSAAHTTEDIDRTVAAALASLQAVAAG